MSSEELWDVLEEDGRKTGRTMRRGEPTPPGLFHLVVDVWIRNRDGKYLVSKRAPNKILPDLWETTGGSALAGEDSLTAALREAREEVGMVLTPGRGRLIHREVRRREWISSILESWLFEEPIGEPVPVCQAEEVSEAKWATLAEILAMTREGIFINRLDPDLSLLN